MDLDVLVMLFLMNLHIFFIKSEIFLIVWNVLQFENIFHNKTIMQNFQEYDFITTSQFKDSYDFKVIIKSIVIVNEQTIRQVNTNLWIFQIVIVQITLRQNVFRALQSAYLNLLTKLGVSMTEQTPAPSSTNVVAVFTDVRQSVSIRTELN